MVFLRRFRRGQIRGIDFSLSMIIFLLTMAQVLTLTTTFIDNAQNSQGVNSDLSVTQSYAKELINTPGFENQGTSLQWNTVETLDLQSNGWQFGLSDGNSSIDPFKLGRVSNNSATDYQLSYGIIKNATSLDRDFEIRIKSTIDIRIDTITDLGAQYSVTGSVTLNSAPISDVSVNIFVNDDTTTEVSDVVTDEDGTFSATVADSIDGGTADVILAMATYSGSHYDYDYEFVGTPVTSSGISIINEDSSNGYGINVVSDITTPNFVAFYSGSSTQNVSVGDTSGLIQVPQDRFVIVLARNGDNVALTSFPIIVDDYLNSPLISSNPFGTESTTIELLINVRQVLLRFVFTTWS